MKRGFSEPPSGGRSIQPHHFWRNRLSHLFSDHLPCPPWTLNLMAVYISGRVCSIILIKISIFVARLSAQQLGKKKKKNLNPWLLLTQCKYLVNACKTVEDEKHPLFSNIINNGHKIEEVKAQWNISSIFLLGRPCGNPFHPHVAKATGTARNKSSSSPQFS